MTQPTAIPPDELRAIAVEAIERVWNGNDWSTAEETYAEDVVVHVPFQEAPLRGREALRGFHETLHLGFPDWRATVDHVLANGDRVAMQWTIRGTHLGPFVGIPPTRRSFQTREAVVGRFAPDGRVAELWFYVDMAGIMGQLGLAPSGPPPKALILALRLKQRLSRKR
jgi:steroid delta-isomerase-like uncharacterized protein